MVRNAYVIVMSVCTVRCMGTEKSRIYDFYADM